MPIPSRDPEEETGRQQVPAPASKIEVINKALKALYQKRPATYKDLAASAGLHPSITSLALSSARDVGLTKLAGKRGLYDFTAAGVDYARFLTQNREAECKDKLREILLMSPLWGEVVSFLKTNQGNARDPIDLILDIERKLGKTWSPAMRRNVSDSYVSILGSAGLIRMEGGKMTSLIGHESAPLEASGAPLPGPSSLTEAPIGRAAPDYWEFRGEGIYMKILRESRSISFAHELLGLLKRQIAQQENTSTVEEAQRRS